jgi:hypothetical protein
MAANIEPGHAAEDLRRRSHGVIELQDDKGRRRTVQLEELSEADRALAEKFGYKPVCCKLMKYTHNSLTRTLGFQA